MEFKKATFDEETVKQLIDLSYIWEKEENTWGLCHNEKSDLGKVCYVAIDKDKIVGYIFGDYSINETHQSFAKKGDMFFDVMELYVLPEYRNRHVGVLVVHASEEWIKELGYNEIIIDSRLEVVPFYEKRHIQHKIRCSDCIDSIGRCIDTAFVPAICLFYHGVCLPNAKGCTVMQLKLLPPWL